MCWPRHRRWSSILATNTCTVSVQKPLDIPEDKHEEEPAPEEDTVKEEPLSDTDETHETVEPQESAENKAQNEALTCCGVSIAVE